MNRNRAKRSTPDIRFGAGLVRKNCPKCLAVLVPACGVLLGCTCLMTVKAPRYAVGDVVLAGPEAPHNFRGRTGIVTEIGPGDSEFRVEFEDGERPTTGYLPAASLLRYSPRVEPIR